MLRINSWKWTALGAVLFIRSLAQTPATIVFPNPTPNPSNLAADSYTRATTKINLMPGFVYGAVTAGATNLLNLNISSNPGYVSSFYANPSSNPNYYNFNPQLPCDVTNGSYRVDGTGTFNYNIPILCSPGTAKIQPEIALAYHAGSSNGWAGLGMDLTGVSAINRIGKSTAYDPKDGGVQLDLNDAFGLDGTRLLLKSGTYGVAGSKYKTPIENYSDIEAFGSFGAGPQYFIVHTSDGLTIEYGKTSDSRHVDVGGTAVLGWYVSKIYDLFGNYMTYTYTNSDGELVISTIEYTGNSNAGLAPYNSIRFTWQTRSDNISYYIAGKEFKRKSLLKRIECWGQSGKPMRSYELEYEYEFASLLSKITEGDGNGNQLNPTYFQWSKDTKVGYPAGSPVNPPIPNVANLAKYQFSMAADMNGDGRKDVVMIDQGSTLKAELMLNQSISYLPTYFTSAGSPFDIDNTGPSTYVAAFALDDNDDDLEELFVVYVNQNVFKMARVDYNNVTGSINVQNATNANLSGQYTTWFTPSLSNPTLARLTNSCFNYAKEDFNGDNIRDELVASQSGVNLKINNVAYNYVPAGVLIKAVPGDFNGNGLTDIYLLSSSGSNPQTPPYDLNVLEFNPSTSTFSVCTTISINTGTSPFIASWSGVTHPITRNLANAAKSIDFGDFDGDGKTDILIASYLNVTNEVSVTIRRSDGTNFLPATPGVTIPNTLNGFETVFSAMDVNNDGMADMMVSSYDSNTSQSTFAYYPCNSGTLTPQTAPVTYGDKYLSVLADFNGDGAVDFLSQNGFMSTDLTLNALGQNKAKRVTRIVNIEDELVISYDYLPSSKNYRNTALVNTSANFKNFRPDIYVATSTSLNGWLLNYGYQNSLVHPQGNGFLGFESVYVVDWGRNGLTKLSSFVYDPSSDNIVSQTDIDTKVSPSGVFSQIPSMVQSYCKTDFSYVTTGSNCYLSGTSAETRNYLSSVRRTVNEDYDNSAGGALKKRIISNLQWTSTQAINTHQFDYVYQSLVNAQNSKPYFRCIKTTETLADASTSSQFVTDYTYDASGRQTSMVENSNHPQAVTTSCAQFNSFGQGLESLISAADLQQSRLNKIEYDPTGRFITKTIDALLNTTTMTYDGSYGNLLSSTDIGGLTTKWYYDELGHVATVQGPTGVILRSRSEWCSIPSLSTNNSAYYCPKHIEETEGLSTATAYYDKMGRVVKTESQGFGGATEVAEWTYGISGNVIAHTPPRYANQNNVRSYGFNYDDFYRTTAAWEFANGSPINVTNYSYNSLSTDATYNKGTVTTQRASGNGSGNHYTVQENNSAGQLSKVINYTNINSPHSAVYSYNHLNQPIQIATTFPGGGGATTSFAYDNLGRQITISDPSAGNHNSAYNSIGQLLQTVSPQGQYNYEYDVLGRMTKRSGSGSGDYYYSYATAGPAKGKISGIAGPVVTTKYEYDGYGRLKQSKETAYTPTLHEFANAFTYDKFNRLVDRTFPNGFKVNYSYDAWGTLTGIATGNTNIWQLTDMSGPGQIARYLTTSGSAVQISYDNSLNLTGIALGNVSNQGYNTSAVTGNMSNRSHQNFATGAMNNEGFLYDDFDRIQQTNYQDANGTTQVKHAYSYQPNGNLSYKQDCGDYLYNNPNKPYQITGLQNQVGNVSLNTLSIIHNDLNKVSQVIESTSNKQFDFVYGNDAQRFKMDYRLGGQLQYSRYYSMGYDLQEGANGNNKSWCYIYTPAGLGAVYYTSNGTSELLNVSCDKLGSPILLTNSAGNVVEEYSFDAWGRRRNPADWNDYTNVSPPQKMIRGYTGHEQLDEIGLINMNGRMYDPVLGWVIEPDPFVIAPFDLQNMNRYSYVLNNPLRYADPDGYRYKRIGQTTVAPDAAPPARPNLEPVLFVDGIRIEPGTAGYGMYLNGGGGVGVATRENFGVWTGVGPGLRGKTTTFGGLMDRGALFKTESVYTTVSGAAFAKAYPEVAAAAMANGLGLDMISGAVEKKVIVMNQQAVDAAQSGGGIDPFGVALGVGELAYQGSVYGSFGRSAEAVDNLLRDGKYLHNGEVYYRGNYPKVTNAMKSSLNAAKLARNIGRTFAVIGVAISIYDFATSNQTASDYARLSGAAIITGAAFIPDVGPLLSVGLGIADSFGAFDDIYNSFGK